MFGGARAQRARMVAETVDFGEDVFASVKGRVYRFLESVGLTKVEQPSKFYGAPDTPDLTRTI